MNRQELLLWIVICSVVLAGYIGTMQVLLHH